MSITLTTRLKRVLFAVLILIIAALPLAFMMEDFIRVAIVTPLAYEIWLIGVIMRALPQRYLMTAALLLATYVALRSIRRVRHTRGHRRVRKRQLQGAVGLWHDRLQQIERGRYSKPRFDQLSGGLCSRSWHSSITCQSAKSSAKWRQKDCQSPTCLNHMHKRLYE